jgi:hypothetical protein
VRAPQVRRFERRDEVFVRLRVGVGAVGEVGEGPDEEAEELERVVVWERFTARRKRSLNAILRDYLVVVIDVGLD